MGRQRQRGRKQGCQCWPGHVKNAAFYAENEQGCQCVALAALPWGSGERGDHGVQGTTPNWCVAWVRPARRKCLAMLAMWPCYSDACPKSRAAKVFRV